MPVKNNNLADLFVTKLKALYDIESQLVKALPKMAKKATDSKLAESFKKHLAETKVHAQRLEKIFRMLGLKPQKTKVEAIRGLIKDGEWVMKNVNPDEARDANLIAAGQYVEHYEMAGYGSAREWAEMLGETDAAKLLSQTLEEEKAADEKLNQLAMSGLNEKAMTI